VRKDFWDFLRVGRLHPEAQKVSRASKEPEQMRFAVQANGLSRASRDCLETPNESHFVVPRACGTGLKGTLLGPFKLLRNARSDPSGYFPDRLSTRLSE
jgi:hypothetical protein